MFLANIEPRPYLCAGMTVTLLTVGKTDTDWVKKGLDAYASRLGHYVRFAMTEIPHLKNASSLSREQIREKEGELIAKALKPSDHVILLDERGDGMRSVDFARMIGLRTGEGRNMVFVVGGAYGFSKSVYDRADGMISLSRMTFPHQMVRIIFAEQLYRAFTILKGEPYHHE